VLQCSPGARGLVDSLVAYRTTIVVAGLRRHRGMRILRRGKLSIRERGSATQTKSGCIDRQRTRRRRWGASKEQQLRLSPSANADATGFWDAGVVGDQSMTLRHLIVVKMGEDAMGSRFTRAGRKRPAAEARTLWPRPSFVPPTSTTRTTSFTPKAIVKFPHPPLVAPTHGPTPHLAASVPAHQLCDVSPCQPRLVSVQASTQSAQPSSDGRTLIAQT
jgi:hypothetical protein